MERNQNGYPVTRGNSESNNRMGGIDPRDSQMRDGCSQNGSRGKCEAMENLCLDSLPVGYAYVPMQKFRMLYPADTALMYGTLFEELNMPVGEYGHD
jgi:hypothetical protein